MSDKGRPVTVVGIIIVYRINRVTTLGSPSLFGGLDSNPGFENVCLCDLGKVISGPHVLHRSNRLTGEDGYEVSLNTDIL